MIHHTHDSSTANEFTFQSLPTARSNSVRSKLPLDTNCRWQVDAAIRRTMATATSAFADVASIFHALLTLLSFLQTLTLGRLTALVEFGCLQFAQATVDSRAVCAVQLRGSRHRRAGGPSPAFAHLRARTRARPPPPVCKALPLMHRCREYAGAVSRRDRISNISVA